LLLAIGAFVLLNQQQFTTPSWLKRFYINMTSCRRRRGKSVAKDDFHFSAVFHSPETS